MELNNVLYFSSKDLFGPKKKKKTSYGQLTKWGRKEYLTVQGIG